MEQKEFKKKINDTKIIELFKEDFKEADDYFSSTIMPRIDEWNNLYTANADYYNKLIPNLSKKSKFVSTDIADTIEYILPDLVKIFYGNNAEVVTIEGRNAEDVEKARVMQELCNYQLNVLNRGFIIHYRWWKDALRFGLGVVKGLWQRDYKTTDNEFYATEEQLSELLSSGIIAEGELVIDKDNAQIDEFGNQTFKVTSHTKVLDTNYPVFENLLPSEILFDPEGRTIEDMKYIIHRKEVTVDYLRKRAASKIFDSKAVEKAIKAGISTDQSFTSMQTILTGYEQPTNTDETSARANIMLYEWYAKIDINNDGFLENCIITIANDTVLGVQENTYDYLPFFLLSGIIDSYSVWGKALADILQHLQNLKTALIKQISYNISLTNESRKYVAENGIRWADIIEGREFIRVKDGYRVPDVVFPDKVEQLHPATFGFLEMLDRAKELKSGINRIKQGVDHSTLNHALETATGATALLEASNARVELIARIGAETGIKDLLQWQVSCNQAFITQPQLVNIAGKNIEIDRDMLQGKFMFIVNAGLGTGMKNTRIANLTTLMQYLVQIGVPNGLSNNKHIASALREFIKEIGFKNTDRYMMPQEEVEQMLQQQQQQQQQQQMMGGQPQQQPQEGQPMQGAQPQSQPTPEEQQMMQILQQQGGVA